MKKLKNVLASDVDKFVNRMAEAVIAEQPSNEVAKVAVIVPHEWQKKEKDIDIDYLVGLTDLEVLGIHFHLLTKVQMVNYVRKDKKIDQDWVMAQAGAGWLAKSILPDLYAERTRRADYLAPGKPGGADDTFLGISGADDPYWNMPGDAGEAFAALEGFDGLGEGI